MMTVKRVIFYLIVIASFVIGNLPSTSAAGQDDVKKLSKRHVKQFKELGAVLDAEMASNPADTVYTMAGMLKEFLAVRNKSEAMMAQMKVVNDKLHQYINQEGSSQIKIREDEIIEIRGVMQQADAVLGGSSVPSSGSEFVFKFSSGTKSRDDKDYYRNLSGLADAVKSGGGRTLVCKAYGDRGSQSQNDVVANKRIAKIYDDLKNMHNITDIEVTKVESEFSSEKNTELRKVVVILK